MNWTADKVLGKIVGEIGWTFLVTLIGAFGGGLVVLVQSSANWAKGQPDSLIIGWCVVLTLVFAGMFLAILRRIPSAEGKGNPLVWALGLIVILIGTGFFLRQMVQGGVATARHSPSGPDIENLEATLRGWLDRFSLSQTKITPERPAHFAIRVQLRNQNSITVIRTKDSFERYLMLIGSVSLTGDHPEKMSKLVASEQDLLMSQMTITLSSLRVGYTIIGMPVKTILFEKRIPITDNLTEEVFIQGLDDIDVGINYVRSLIRARLDGPAQLSGGSGSTKLGFQK